VLGVVTGLKSEAKLLKSLGLACVSTGGQAREARRKIDRLIAEGATGLISFGIAGALSPELKTGDLDAGLYLVVMKAGGFEQTRTVLVVP